MVRANTGQCASEEVEPRKGWTQSSVPVRMLSSEGSGLGVPHRLEKGTSAREDVGPRRGVDCKSTSIGEENETFFIRV